jgi:heptosyltransferase-2
VELLLHNQHIDVVVPLDHAALALLMTEPFDLVLNPDAAMSSCRLASLAHGRQKVGYTLDIEGRVHPTNDAARAWYEMGLNDSLKKANRRTYQSILLDICELPDVAHPIIWQLSEDEKQFAGDFARRRGLLDGQGIRVGLNTGAGGRWRWKQWTAAGFSMLIGDALKLWPDARVLLYGGPAEREKNAKLAAADAKRVVDTGAENGLREFGAMVSLCDVMVTGDTMAMHIATALGKPVVALFGPTSHAEIDLYGRGMKIVPEGLDCLGCYLSDCEVRPSCMERITAEQVLDGIRASLAADASNPPQE